MGDLSDDESAGKDAAAEAPPTGTALSDVTSAPAQPAASDGALSAQQTGVQHSNFSYRIRSPLSRSG